MALLTAGLPTSLASTAEANPVAAAVNLTGKHLIPLQGVVWAPQT